jgi:hypothetical protein
MGALPWLGGEFGAANAGVPWLDPCGWDAERRVIIPRTGFAAAKLRSEIMRVLAVRQVSIQEMQA